MAHDVFISYSSKDKTVADAVCAKLESQKIRCWIAPRDVPAGQPYAASLVKAIRESSVIVLILSQGSNQSMHVLREIGEAVENGIAILPFRIDDVDPTEEMHYYIKSIHWLDAMSPPLERHLEKLASSVQALLNVNEPIPETRGETAFEVPVQKFRKIPTWAIILIGFIALGILGGAGSWFLKHNGQVPMASSPSNTVQYSIETTISTQSPVLSDTQRRTLNFIIPSEDLWRKADDSYTAISKPSGETIAWSDEIIIGDFILTAEVANEQPDLGNAAFIIYGDGIGFSKGCLVFVFGSGFAYISKDSLYQDGSFLIVNEGDFNFRDGSHDFSIEITGDVANFYVDGQKVAFTSLPSEINHSGRIGLWQGWEAPVGTKYSNIKIMSLSEGD
jgi:TIR domain